jgi:hypothetical protein
MIYSHTKFLKYSFVFCLLNLLTLQAQEIKMCGYQGYQTVDEVNSACDLQGASTSSSSTEAATIVVDNILDKVGLFRNFLIEECDDINNALAVTMPLEGGDIERYILYDQDFFSKVSASTGTDWGNTSILAHEVGHHLNGHTLKSGGSNHKIELQADEFSGFVLARMKCSLEDAQSAVSNLLPEEASSTHPAKKDRLNAIEKGWNRGNGKTIHVKKIEDVKKEIEEIVIEDKKEEEEIIANNEEELIQAILGRYIEAIGGQEKVSQIKTFYQDRKISTTMRMDETDMETEMISKIHYLKPSQVYQNMTSAINGSETKMETLIKDGKVFIKNEMFKEWTLQEKNSATFFKNSTSYIPEYSQLIKNAKAIYLGIKEVNGTACYVIKFDEEEIMTNMSIVSTKYFNTKNGLLVFEIQKMFMGNPSFASETISKITYKEYQEVNGILFSFKQEQEMEMIMENGNANQTIKSSATTLFSDIQINPVIDASKFEIND